MKQKRPQFVNLVSAAMLALVLAVFVSAQTPADYRTRLETAREDVEHLIEDLRGEIDDDTNEVVADIKKGIPATETIELGGASIETDNRWLHKAIDEFAKGEDQGARELKLIEINERLLAVSETVTELETAAAAEPAKDEEKQKLAEILAREEYQKPAEKTESTFQRWIREFFEWLEQAFPSRPDLGLSDPDRFASFQFVLQVVIFVIVGAIAIFILWRLLPFLRGRRRGGSDEDGDRIILGERIDDGVSAGDLLDEAEGLARSGDLRGAIRKGYVALLIELSERRQIRLARHKTNRDYLRDIRRSTGLYQPVSEMTAAFESNWYGLRTAEAAEWERFKQLFGEARQQARRPAQ